MWRTLEGIQVHVLPVDARPVPRLVKPRRDGRGVGPDEGPGSAARREVREHSRVMGILAGEEARAARHAEGRGGEGVRERDPLCDQQLLHGGHVGEGVPPLIVGEEEHDVRAGRVRDAGRAGHATCEHRREQRQEPRVTPPASRHRLVTTVARLGPSTTNVFRALRELRAPDGTSVPACGFPVWLLRSLRNGGGQYGLDPLP